MSRLHEGELKAIGLLLYSNTMYKTKLSHYTQWKIYVSLSFIDKTNSLTIEFSYSQCLIYRNNLVLVGFGM